MRRLALLVAAAAVTTLGTVAPANAVPGNICPYPVANTALSLNQEFTTVRVGQPFSVGGYLTRNGCGLPQGNVGLFFRERPGAFSYFNKINTNANGAHGFRLSRVRSVDLIVIFSGEANYSRAQSRTIHVTVVR